MRLRHETFQVTCPASTPRASPVEVATGFDAGVVRLIRLKIPAGHASLTGIQIAYAHQPIIPRTPGAFILGNSDRESFDVDERLDSGGWSAFLYNTDTRSHYWQLIFDVDDDPAERRYQGPAPRAIAPALIQAAAVRSSR